MTLPVKPLSMTLNGAAVGPIDVPEGLMMIDFLSEYVGVTGPRFGCGIGVCHACTVIVDGPGGSEEIRTCITGAHYFAGRKVRTVEGLASRDAQGRVVGLTTVQQKYLEHYSFQCGYCTPGFVMGATVLMERLKRQPVAKSRVEAVVSDALEKHICRCTGYVRYYAAVKDAILSTPGLTVEG